MIDSRVIQGVICDSCITPLMERRLIYDNPASTKGKGVSHARGRIDRHLQKLVRENGPDFYILNYDLKIFLTASGTTSARRKWRSSAPTTGSSTSPCTS